MMKRLVILFLFTLSLTTIIQAQQPQDEEPITLRDGAPDPEKVELQQIMTGLVRPLYITHAGDGSDRLFVVEQGGRITVVSGTDTGLFLDLSNLVSASANRAGFTERGLLGLAFHPDHAENGQFFVDYTDRSGHTVLARYTVSSRSPDFADADSADVILTQQQPFANHNGGHIAFGPDGYLYVSLGDGGDAGDPLRSGQNTNLLLGSILRLDVDGGGAYSIPEDNPFADGAAGKPEIWAWGLRNPWRFSFDRATDDLYIGDAGQNRWEEVNFEPADSPGGLNYGWNILEGSHAYSGAAVPEDVVMPIAEYAHDMGCSVTGGYVYRGEAIPDLQGAYLYGDYCSGNVWAAYRDATGAWQSELFLRTGLQISSFGEDEDGELYIVHYIGDIYKIVPAE